MSLNQDEYTRLKEEVLTRTFAGLQDMTRYAEQLKVGKRLRHARDIIRKELDDRASTRDEAGRRELKLMLALHTYRDPSLGIEGRTREALDLLAEVDSLDRGAGVHHIALAMTGDVRKLAWEVLNVRRREGGARSAGGVAEPPVGNDRAAGELGAALSYFRRSFELCDEPSAPALLADLGYTGLNAAFLLDLLAAHAAASGDAASGAARREQARAIRGELEARVSAAAAAAGPGHPDGWWFFSNATEVYAGLGQYADARARAERLVGAESVKVWMINYVAGRLFTLAELQGAGATDEDQLETFHRLAVGLMRKNSVGDARRVMMQARRLMSLAEREADFSSPRLGLKLAQAHSSCTFRDPGLPADRRLTRGLAILEEVERLSETRSQRTLGQAGAIHKRMWEADGRKEHLERALHFFLRGYHAAGHAAADYDNGYSGNNAAFVLDALADIEDAEARKAGAVSAVVAGRRELADRIRRQLVRDLPKAAARPDRAGLDQTSRYQITMGQAYFGLREYETASLWLERAARQLPREAFRERERTVRLLVAQAGTRQGDGEIGPLLDVIRARRALRSFLGDYNAALRSALIGKIGLGLSGGGFRASLFHVGVLAKLAELDVLRHVEVLSCVSGGSIVGAHYYLELQHLLETKPDNEITRDDYIKIVREMEEEFLAGVQQNIRMLVVRRLRKNLSMMFQRAYSRTKRAGELYEEVLYSRVGDGKQGGERWLDQLLFHPNDEGEGFNPKTHNWLRGAKVPQLILNAATLNTGHNWQFTGSWMGEPPGGINTEVDANHRLRRMYHWEVPAAHQDVRLGHAVAASSCVPALFSPLALAGIYPGQTVLLVDGGAHDNQGTSSLLEQGCNVLLVSDASGQMQTDATPSTGIINLLMRTYTVVEARLRGAQYSELDARRRSSLLRGLMFIHLLKDIDDEPVCWVGCEDPHDRFAEVLPARSRGPRTRYGIRKDVQKLLAAIRTDLDSFNRQEAYALMTSGYRMTQYELPECVGGFPERVEQRPRWRFLSIEGPMTEGGDEAGAAESDELKTLKRLLRVGGKTAFKIWWLSRPLQVVTALALVALLVALVSTRGFWWSVQLLTLGSLATFVLLYVVQLVAGETTARVIQFREEVREFFVKLAVCLLGTSISWLHLRYFDKWYLRRGEWDLTRHAEWERRYDEVAAQLKQATRDINKQFGHAGDVRQLEAKKRRLVEEMVELARDGHSPAQRFEAHRTAGKELMSLNEVAEAHAQYLAAHELDPSDLESYRRIGILTNRRGDREGALRIADEVIRTNPGDAESWSLLGRLHKEEWLRGWRVEGKTLAEMRAAAAECAPPLRKAVKAYLRGFAEDSTSFYAGINALTFLKILLDLRPDERVADAGLAALTAEVRSSVDAGVKKDGDYWAKVTLGDFKVLAEGREEVVAAYEAAADMAVENSDWFGLDSSRQQLLLLRDVGFRVPEVGAALRVFDEALARRN